MVVEAIPASSFGVSAAASPDGRCDDDGVKQLIPKEVGAQPVIGPEPLDSSAGPTAAHEEAR